MKFYRIWALIERDMRKFFRSPALMMASMVFPLVQLIVLGYAFGGKIKGAHDSVRGQGPFGRIAEGAREFAGIETGPQTFRVVDIRFGSASASTICKAGFVQGVIEVPQDFSRRFYHHDRPQIAFTEDNTDQVMASALLERVQQMVDGLNAPDVESATGLRRWN